MKIDDPNEDFQSIVFRRLDALEKARPVGFTDVSRGALRITSVEGLIVEGSAKVTGTLVVTGVEEIDGTLTVTGSLVTSGDTFLGGPVTIAGDTEITGTTTINGATDINGDTDVTGQMDLSGTLNVIGGGKINAGVVVIDGTDGGRIAASGATLSLVGTQITFTGATTARNGMLSEGDLISLQDVVATEELKNPGITPSTAPGLKGVVVDPASGKFFYTPRLLRAAPTTQTAVRGPINRPE